MNRSSQMGKNALSLVFLGALVAAAAATTEFGVKLGRHGWRGPQGRARTVVVDQHGGGHFGTVQAAVDSVPRGNRRPVTIVVRAGLYREKVTVPAGKPFITLAGAGVGRTVIDWHDKASDMGPDGVQLNTYNSASVTVLANHFSARNVTFRNSSPGPPSPGVEGFQAVAMRVAGDKCFFLGCAFQGSQDTLCDEAGRHLYTHCLIQGSIDFIFGNARSLFYRCHLRSTAAVFGSVAAHARASGDDDTGFAFVACTVSAAPAASAASPAPLYLGRAMGRFSRIVYAFCFFDAPVAGWDDWDHQTPHGNVFFGVYHCWGPGAPAALSVPWVRRLTPAQAAPFVHGSFINARTWVPTT